MFALYLCAYVTRIALNCDIWTRLTFFVSKKKKKKRKETADVIVRAWENNSKLQNHHSKIARRVI